MNYYGLIHFVLLNNNLHLIINMIISEAKRYSIFVIDEKVFMLIFSTSSRSLNHAFVTPCIYIFSVG
mgnify:CR=1 FL=1